MQHFAHRAGSDCKDGYETSMHLAAKEILLKAEKIVLPAVYVQFPDSYKHKILLFESQEIKIERVELEKRFDDIIPDVVVWSGGKCFFIEIYVTSCVNENKLRKIEQADISTLEIDISKKEVDITADEFREVLLGKSEEKNWIYNSKANRILEQFYQLADRREIINRGCARHVDHCPVKSRIWRGKAYANLLEDCLSCEFCISTDYDEGMLCSGRLRIATLEDIKSAKKTK